MTIHDLDTPALICELDITERNLRAMQAACDAHGVDLRPHIKTHKVPELARWQLDLGAVGLTCAKLGEAEVMADQAGCDDIFLAYSLVGEEKHRRLLALLDRIEVRVSVVSLAQAQLLSAGLGGRSVKVRLNVDCGLERDGVDPEEAVSEALRIAELPGIELVGVFTHEGQAHAGATVDEVHALGRQAVGQLVAVAERLRAQGVACKEVAPGATPTAADVTAVAGVTEVRPGTYIFSDAMCMETMELGPGDCAVRVITTVVDRPAPHRVILDGGSKTFFNDHCDAWGRAYCVDNPKLRLEKCSEEHGHAEWTGDGPAPFELGDRVTWIPSHVCPVVNLFDQLVAVRGERVETVYQVAARGKVR
ncbi:MAG: alanine racemase [Armatimonadetes bacterium]|nr:alanine racemase [Armatimonadota bacterium]